MLLSFSLIGVACAVGEEKKLNNSISQMWDDDTRREVIGKYHVEWCVSRSKRSRSLMRGKLR